MGSSHASIGALVCLALAGCGSSTDESSDPGPHGFTPPQEAPENTVGGFSIQIPSITMEPGEELLPCYIFPLELTGPSHFVAAGSVTTSEGMHHGNVTTRKKTGEGIRPCPPEDNPGVFGGEAGDIFHGGAVLFGSSTQLIGTEWHRFPPGYAYRVKDGYEIVARMHYLNVSQKKVTVRPEYHWYTIPEEDLVDEVGPFAWTLDKFEIPPLSEHTESAECTMYEPMHIVDAMPHMHALGTRFEVTYFGGPRDGEHWLDDRRLRRVHRHPELRPASGHFSGLRGPVRLHVEEHLQQGDRTRASATTRCASCSATPTQRRTPTPPARRRRVAWSCCLLRPTHPERPFPRLALSACHRAGPRTSIRRSMADPRDPSLLDGMTVAHALGSPSSSTESTDLLQERLAVFARLMLVVSVWLYVAGFVLVAIFVPEMLISTHLHPAKLLNVGAGVVSGGLWLVLRRRRFSLPTLRFLDTGFALGTVLMAHIAVATVPLGYAAELIAVLATLLSLGLRAALVPSPPRRTTTIALLATLSLGALAVYTTRSSSLPYPLTPGIVIFGCVMWGIVIAGVTNATSRVVYGLQRQVEQALRLGQYTLGEKLGEGGMGAVYLAQHAMLRRPTAVKLLPPDRAGTASLARFEREVQLTSLLTHPNTIAVYDYGRTTSGVFYYAMEYVDGLSLEDLVDADGPQPPERVIHILRQVAGALGEAHHVGLIHRDVKPANILLCERGGIFDVVKVVDFGLVKQLEAPADATVTRADTITGTPAYLAPEMIVSPDSLDGRADLYGLGGVGYFLLTGGPVFAGKTIMEVCAHHLHTPPERPSIRRGEDLPDELERTILACLAKEPSDRPASASALEARLAELTAGHPWPAASAEEWWKSWRACHPSRSRAPGAVEATTVAVA